MIRGCGLLTSDSERGAQPVAGEPADRVLRLAPKPGAQHLDRRLLGEGDAGEDVVALGSQVERGLEQGATSRPAARSLPARM